MKIISEYFNSIESQNIYRENKIFTNKHAVSKLARMAETFDNKEGWSEDSISKFIRFVFLQSETKEEKKKKQEQEKNRKGKVSLVTFHASKGLEFPIVFLASCIEGIIPHKNASLPKEIEEERRLLYVAMTRAQSLLCICHPTRSVSKEIKNIRQMENDIAEAINLDGVQKKKKNSNNNNSNKTASFFYFEDDDENDDQELGEITTFLPLSSFLIYPHPLVTSNSPSRLSIDYEIKRKF